MFFEKISSFANNTAIIEAESGKTVTYAELQLQIDVFSNEHLRKNRKQLVFIECSNSIDCCVAVLANLQVGNVIHLVANISDNKTKKLIELYQPNLIIDKENSVSLPFEKTHKFADGLTLLLSTSGSTGTPKFVKLSAENIHSNAEAIACYLKLTSNDIAMSHLKLHYSYGVSVLTSHLNVGATLCMTNSSVLDNDFWQFLKQYKATSFAGVPYTFESLHKRGFNFSKYPSLRYVTQAGGKLESSLVKWFAENGAKSNVEFYVMYGQTEASPRISYLPPELAQKHGACIGKAIPGGELYIVNDQGNRIEQLNTPGELAYKGPNVMLGYATSPEELASNDNIEFLLTGDIACINEDGLFYIVGRTKRFIKPFGVRVNLDEVQSFVKEHVHNSAVAGTDEKLHILIEGETKDIPPLLLSSVVDEFKIPKEVIVIKTAATIPLLANGKYDYNEILALKLKSKPIWQKFVDYIADILELRHTEWDSISHLYTSALNEHNILPTQSFNDLQGDSLSFVYVSVELENLLGDSLPENWFELTLGDMESILQKLEAA